MVKWKLGKDFGRQSAGFPSEDEYVIRFKRGCVKVPAALGRHCEQPTPGQGRLAGRPVGMTDDPRVFVVVEAGSSQSLVSDIEAEWFNQMEFGTGVGAKTNDVACIGRDFGLIENDGGHGDG